MDIAQI